MPYLPLSQIITGSYTNGGEFKLFDSINDPSPDVFITYMGPYLTTSKNEFYTGENFTRSSKKLVKVDPVKLQLSTQNQNNIPLNTQSPIITVLNKSSLTSATDGLPLDYQNQYLLFDYQPESVYNSRNVPTLYTYILSKEKKKLHEITRKFKKKNKKEI